MTLDVHASAMKLSAYLQKHELSHNAFGKLAGVSGSTILRILKDGMLPRSATTEKICLATMGKVSAAELIQEAVEARGVRPAA